LDKIGKLEFAERINKYKNWFMAYHEKRGMSHGEALAEYNKAEERYIKFSKRFFIDKDSSK